MAAQFLLKRSAGSIAPMPKHFPTSWPIFLSAPRAQLAVFLYGRTHTRELGVRVAATCEAALLMQTAGTLGEVIYAQSRDGYMQPTYGEDRRPSKGAISLAGSRKARDQHA